MPSSFHREVILLPFFFVTILCYTFTLFPHCKLPFFVALIFSCFSGGVVTVYVYFDPEPLPVDSATAVIAAQHTAQFSLTEGRRGRAMKRGSSGNGTVTGALREKLVRVLSDRNGLLSSPVPPMEGQQDVGGSLLSSMPQQASATTTTLGKLVVVVADNGPGISAENQKRLFKEV